MTRFDDDYDGVASLQRLRGKRRLLLGSLGAKEILRRFIFLHLRERQDRTVQNQLVFIVVGLLLLLVWYTFTLHCAAHM